MVQHNQGTFEESACAGGASSGWPDEENVSLISDGDNRFDANANPVARTRGQHRLELGHSKLNRDRQRQRDRESNGRRVLY